MTLQLLCVPQSGIPKGFFPIEKMKNTAFMFSWVTFIPTEFFFCPFRRLTLEVTLQIDLGAFWTCILFGNTDISVVLCNVTAIQAFIPVCLGRVMGCVMGWQRSPKHYFSCFPPTVTLCALSFQSVCPLQNSCSYIQCHSACSVSFEQNLCDLLLYYSYFTFSSIFSFFVYMSISCVFPATWRKWFCVLLTLAW